MFSHLMITACLLAGALSHIGFSSDSPLYRNLKAARSHGNLLRRSNDISLSRYLLLTYAEESASTTDDKIFASQVHLRGGRPALLLEELDHLLDLVECSESTMTLVFHHHHIFEMAKSAHSDVQGSLIVSSHSTCSDPGAHSVFTISDLEYDESERKVVLRVEETTFRKAFPSKKVEFGFTSEPHYSHRHDRLSRRQDNALTAPGAIASAASTLIPTETPTVESVTFDLSDDQTDSTFSWPSDVQLGPNIPITVGCEKCTTKGELILTQGEIDLSGVDELTEQFIEEDKEMDFITSGFFQLELNGFESSILLKASPSASLNFVYDLFSVPVLGFRIPNFGAAGIAFQPQLAFDIGLQGGIELTWGFKVNVPDHSTVRLDVGQFNNSAITGFDKATVEALPFNANASDIEITLKAGLRPFIPLGINFLDGDVILQGGPYLDLPYISTTMTQLATNGVNENCETGKGQTNEKFQNAFQNLTHISSDVGMGVGFEFEATFDVPLIPFDLHKAYNYSIWSTATPLPTACLAFQKETGLVEASAAVKSVGAASSFSFRPSNELPVFLRPFGQFAILALCALTAIFAVM